MKKLRRNSFLTLLCMVFLTGTAQADSALKLIKDVEVHAFASSSYSYNFNQPSTRQNAFRVFDADDNTFKFDAGELVLFKDAKGKGDAGFRFDMSFGFSQPEINIGPPGPNVGGVDVSDNIFDVQQGYISYIAPIGSGLQLDLGKFITHIGAEVMDGYDGFNYSFSRSFLFCFGPYTHTGLRATYKVSDKVSVLGMIANSWDNQTDNNAGKTFGTQVALTPWDGVAIYLNWVGGPEIQPANASNEDDSRNLWDIIAEINLTEKLLININAVYGNDDNAIAAGDDANWWGISTILRHDWNEWLSFNLRGQIFGDQDGFQSGTIQDLWAISLTPEIRVTNNAVFRIEFRHDESDVNVFDDDGTAVDDQNTIAAQGIFYF